MRINENGTAEKWTALLDDEGPVGGHADGGGRLEGPGEVGVELAPRPGAVPRRLQEGLRGAVLRRP